MKENIKLSINIEPLNKINPLISRYLCNIAAVDVKANKYVFSKEILQKIIPSLKGAPILTHYSEIDEQFTGHEDDYFVSKKTNKIKRTPELKAIGFVDYLSEPTFKMIDLKEWLVCTCYLWEGRYSFLENLSTKKIHQSMEVAVDYDEMPDGTKQVTDAILIGLALIGVDPAFEGSTFIPFSNSNIQTEINQLKQEYEEFANKEITNFPTQGENKVISLKNSNYNQFDYEYASKLKEEFPQIWKKGGNIRGNEAFEYWGKARNGEKSQGVLDWIKEREAWSARHYKNKNLNGVIAQIKWGIIGSRGMNYMKSLINEEKKKYEKLSYFSNEEINNKTVENVLENNGEIIDDIKNNETNKDGESVIKEAVEKFSLTSSQIHEILNNALNEFKYGEHDYRKYWTNCFDDEYVYVEDSEHGKTYRMKYTISENLANVDMESKEEVIRGGYIPVGENKEDMSNENMAEDDDSEEDKNKEETDEENKSEVSSEQMSSNDYVDNGAMQELNDKSAEDNKELSNEQMNVEDDKDKIIAGLKEEMSAMQEKMSKMEADMTVYMDENEKLKEFKANIEKQNKEFEIKMTLKEVMESLPKEEVEACRMSAENFSLENINIWKNEVQAKAFKFSKGVVEKKPYIQVAIPTSETPKRGTGLWD